MTIITVVKCTHKELAKILDAAFCTIGVTLVNFDSSRGGCILMFLSENAKADTRLFNTIKHFNCLIMGQ